LNLKILISLLGPTVLGKAISSVFFRMLRAMSEEGLANFVMENGGADGFREVDAER
jgi:hypothetical protein